MRNIIPLILAITLMTLVCILSYFRAQSTTLNLWTDFPLNSDIVFAGSYIFWLVIESVVSKKELTKGTKTSDFGTCELYAFGQAMTLLSALWFKSHWSSPGMIHAFGGLIFCSGVLFRLWAVHTLGRYYSHIVREVDEHKIIESGPYKFIRHPAYTGMILANIGVTTFFFNWHTLSFFLLVLVPAIILRIIIEEKTLMRIKGYMEYSKQKKRLMPLIWSLFLIPLWHVFCLPFKYQIVMIFFSVHQN